MPQASENLRTMWTSDKEALDALRACLAVQLGRGVVYVARDAELSERETSAVDYLFAEWDYAVEPAA